MNFSGCAKRARRLSVLQRLWDLQWRRNNPLMLVLCGSNIGFMEREVLGVRFPLYGRRAGDLPAPRSSCYQAADAFHPQWSLEEQARAYFVCGGIPPYLRRLDPGRSVSQNLARELFEPDSFFQREREYLLCEKLSDVKQAGTSLLAVARGRYARSEIARDIELSPSALDPHLKNLTSLGYLEPVVPLSNVRTKTAAVVYRIADPLLRFWFQFMEPNRSAWPLYTSERAFERFVFPQWESFCGDAFERLCREALPWVYSRDHVPGRFQVGEYWDRDVQVDVAGLRAGSADLGECRWVARTNAPAAARELAARAKRFPAGERTLRYVVFFRKKLKSAPPDTRVFGLADLYAPPRT